MSTILYAALTAKREAATPGTSKTDQPPAMSTYVDAMAALVPAEVLSVHALILTFTTSTVTGPTGENAVTISAPSQLTFAFWALVVISALLYVARMRRVPMGLDLIRMCIPPLAFAAWTMLQKSTAFDAAFPGVEQAWRSVVAVLGAVVLGGVATWLAEAADKQVPKQA